MTFGRGPIAVGCHESKYHAPSNQGARPLAMLRPPSKLQPEGYGSYPLTFPRLVQPVLDKHCVDCHAQESKAFPLDGGLFGAAKNKKRSTGSWSNGFNHLSNYGWGKHGGNGSILINKTSYSIPGKVGAKASRLLPILEKGHYDVKLNAAELRRITTWLDCNTNYYGAYREAEKQRRGEVVMPKVHTAKPTQRAR